MGSFPGVALFGSWLFSVEWKRGWPGPKQNLPVQKKIQDPNTKEVPSPKFQNKIRRLSEGKKDGHPSHAIPSPLKFCLWSFSGVWILVFGVSSFSFQGEVPPGEALWRCLILPGIRLQAGGSDEPSIFRVLLLDRAEPGTRIDLHWGSWLHREDDCPGFEFLEMFLRSEQGEIGETRRGDREGCANGPENHHYSHARFLKCGF